MKNLFVTLAAAVALSNTVEATKFAWYFRNQPAKRVESLTAPASTPAPAKPALRISEKEFLDIEHRLGLNMF